MDNHYGIHVIHWDIQDQLQEYNTLNCFFDGAYVRVVILFLS